MTENYCSQNDGDCSTCSLVNYGRDCQNNLLSERVTKISFQDWFKSWFIDTVQSCDGCMKDLHFWDEAYQHCGLDGVFCSDCAKIFQSGSVPELVE
jgi:hypothetical protein